MAANRVEYRAIASNIKERQNDSTEGQTTALWKEKLKMIETAPKVIVIPAKPELTKQRTIQHQLRVAAYCRVSTDDEEQLTSYEAQQ